MLDNRFDYDTFIHGASAFDTFAHTPDTFCCPKEGSFVDIYLFSISSIK